MARVTVWVILFFNFSLFKSKKNHIPVLLASLCFGDSLVYRINPKVLRYHISNPDNMAGNLFIWSGEWDKDVTPIEEHEKFVMIKELFVNNKDYRDTQFYSNALNRMLAGKPLKRGNITLDSIENIDLYFEKHKRIFNDIKTNGFDLNIAPDVGVTVGRDGKLIHFRQGHHTLSIAKILGIENINIRIRALHSIWLSEQIDSGRRLNLLNSVRKGLKKIFD